MSPRDRFPPEEPREWLNRAPHVVVWHLEAGYREMARDKAREAEAQAWAEATVADVADETR